MIPAALAVSFPCDLYGRATIACAAFAAEIAIAMAESSMQLANATGAEIWIGATSFSKKCFFSFSMIQVFKGLDFAE